MASAPRLFVPLLALTLATAACGGKQVEDTPPPAPEVPTMTPEPVPVSTQLPQRAPSLDARRATLEQRIHFALDRADLSFEARRVLADKAEILKSTPNLTLRIDGHADDRGSDEYNLALSQRRAAEAKRFMMQQGVEATRLVTVGHGEELPIDRHGNESAWAMNRRADFQVAGGSLTQR
jgi:peptidoglycan-associated lipoprotein